MNTQVKTLTDDALGVLLAIAVAVDCRLYRGATRARLLWINLTDDYFREREHRGVLESHEEVTNEPHTP